MCRQMDQEPSPFVPRNLDDQFERIRRVEEVSWAQPSHFDEASTVRGEIYIRGFNWRLNQHIVRFYNYWITGVTLNN